MNLCACTITLVHYKLAIFLLNSESLPLLLYFLKRTRWVSPQKLGSNFERVSQCPTYRMLAQLRSTEYMTQHRSIGRRQRPFTTSPEGDSRDWDIVIYNKRRDRVVFFKFTVIIYDRMKHKDSRFLNFRNYNYFIFRYINLKIIKTWLQWVLNLMVCTEYDCLLHAYYCCAAPYCTGPINVTLISRPRKLLTQYVRMIID